VNTRALVVGLALALLAATPAGAQMAALVHDSIGIPLKPEDAAAGSWTLQVHGERVCSVELSGAARPDGIYPARIPRACAQVLPDGLVGWRPVTDGMALVDAGGAVMVDFNQWAPWDLQSKRAGAETLELIRPRS
jgi:hypothetical protein